MLQTQGHTNRMRYADPSQTSHDTLHDHPKMKFVSRPAGGHTNGQFVTVHFVFIYLDSFLSVRKLCVYY